MVGPRSCNALPRTEIVKENDSLARDDSFDVNEEGTKSTGGAKLRSQVTWRDLADLPSRDIKSTN